jgi:acyl-CoA hydrolase
VTKTEKPERTEREARAEKEPRSPADSASQISELMMPQHANMLGNVFGGVVLSMVDRAAAVTAMRHSGHDCVTVSIDRVDFREPIYVGELVTCVARVTFVGRTSMEIWVRVLAENLLTGVERHANTCFLTFVAIDDDHRPIPVRPLKLKTEDDRRRFNEGRRRREVRQALAKELGEDR